MAKRRDVLKRIERRAKAAGVEWGFDHEGGRHTMYRLGGQLVPIPRHKDINEMTTEGIYRECAGLLGEGWWRR